jgi:hypothetical protein
MDYLAYNVRLHVEQVPKMKTPIAMAFGLLLLSAASASAATVNGDIDKKLDSMFAGVSTLSVETSDKTDGGELDDVISPVPVPAAGLMLLAGLGGLAAMRRRNRA